MNRRRLVAGIALAILILLGCFVICKPLSAGPEASALPALVSGPDVLVEVNDWLVFKPAGGDTQSGLVFYPGGLVDPRAYAPLARAIAAGGHTVIIVPMPLDLAVFNAGAASEVVAAFPGIRTWVIGGHSLGGAMAASYAGDHPGEMDGLVLLASYPPDSTVLKDQKIMVVSIYGSADGVADHGLIEDARDSLPLDTQIIRLEGGNHAQFGYYGAQRGDGVATMSREEQQSLTIEHVLELLSVLQD
jgi:hypothetical protein